MKILVLFPSRSRPERFRKAIDSYWGLADNVKNIQFIISLDIDDTSVYDIHEAENLMVVRDITPKDGAKIYACNRDLHIAKKMEWDIICLASDDMIANMPGWDSRIIDAMKKNFPDTDGYLHFDDSHQHGNCCTFTIMGRKYFDRFGYLYFHEYKSLWCDVEQTEVAWMLGKYKYMGDDYVIVRHEHPIYNKHVGWDNQYATQSTQAAWEIDKKVIEARRLIKYGLKEIEIVNEFKYKTL